jgi:pimeloyl-[acyl-carrier protein] methyl ester esterase
VAREEYRVTAAGVITAATGATAATAATAATEAIAVPALHSETSGDIDAEPLVLLHGFGLNLRVFDALVATLAPHYRVTAIDLPGHGASPWNAQLPSSQWLAAVAALLPPAATLVGWSLGGQLALQLASQPALAVRGLVLMATSPRFVQSNDWAAGVPAATLQGFAAQLERDAARTIADFLELQVRGSLDAAAVRTSLQQALQRHGVAHPEALRAGLALLQHNDLRELARSIDVPTLVVAGQYDRVTPPQAAQALVRLLPQAQLLQIPRAGHAPFLSHPAAVGAALLDFMRSGARRWRGSASPVTA